ncbi:signal transduction histidine kinase [Streptomyces sp. V4I23]|uniref:sensor histidine kinase n=1 Tax=Streptomyces sp. V4I23 TaxID=3042282 RepID=UPI002788A480|nr:HAMP domain-containing sensor histidine kinase [Streptomyces sp. V4I23]MDQ1007711.1 signal transduction histidine kinase [Streptomyces sp. V4I23]
MRLTYVTALGAVIGGMLAVLLATTGWLYARHVGERTATSVAGAAVAAQAELATADRSAEADGDVAGRLVRLARQEDVELSLRRPDGTVQTSASDPSAVHDAFRAVPSPPDGHRPGLRTARLPLVPSNGLCAVGWFPLEARDARSAVLLVRRSCADARSHVLTAWTGLAVLWPVALAGCLFPVLALRRRSVHDLRDIQRTVRAISAGAYHLRAEPGSRGHDLNLLAADVNRLAAALQCAAEEQHHFLADVAHQLRNPLIALRLRIENIAVELPDSAADRHARLLADVDRLDRTLTDMLEHARGNPAELSTQVVNVCAVVEECVRGWAAVAEQRGIRMRLDRPRRAWALARTGAVEQAMNVLLDNALKHSPEGSAVHIGITVGTLLEIRVRDEGPGMSRAEREAALTRGWRGGEQSSHGIGLSIAAKLVASCGGRLELLAYPGPGLCAVLRLPRVASGDEDDPSRPPVRLL